ncbi:ATP-binding protein [Wukongibacter baidiensis]|uniref:HAMP domain-containing sensor histidine kinase n=1 Tax=Wukongibacter baidiensis TaxID=1723361 RepID=UPI003D7F69EC
MRFGIRIKLFISFTIVIVLPLILTGLLLYYSTTQLQNDPRIRELEKVKLGRHEIVDIIEDNYSMISESDKLYKIIRPLLEKYQLNVEIQDVDGYTLLDSKNFKDSSKGNSKDKKADTNEKTIKNKTVLNVFHNNKVILKVIFYQYKSNESIEEKAKFYNLLTYGLGGICLIVLVIIFTWYMSGTILKPLKELNKATENISKGNLEYQIQYKNNDEIGKFCIAFDTMREKLKESLEKQVEYEKSRRELIASISHDLRTPITSIKGYVDGLDEGIASDKEMFQRYISVIKDKTQKLDHLIDDLFQYSKMESGQLDMNIRCINSMEFFEEVFGNLEIEFKDSPIDVVIQRPIPMVEMNIDYYRINQIIDNLIQNAKRYVDEKGRIVVGVNLKDNKLEVFVKDNGQGISKKDLPYIFEKFYRGEKSRSREYGGSGLGLSICKYIIEAHNGSIWANSGEGEGTIFYFSLPIDIDNNKEKLYQGENAECQE